MKQGTTTKINVDTGDYFMADVDNGGVRLGLRDVCSFDVPAGHAKYEAFKAVTADTIENVFDEHYAATMIGAKA